MHVMGEFLSFSDCYIQLARKLAREPDYVVSPRGMRVKELSCVGFTLTDPLNRLIHVEGRKASLEYAFAELLWYLSGDDTLAWISHYSSFWMTVSDDGITANSAYGARIFKSHARIGSCVNQWQYVIDELRRDPDSRRAVIHIRVPSDSLINSKDVPCTLTLHFMQRNGKLDLIVNMRSSDIVFGLTYDVPAFTVLQELLALTLNIDVGTYTHISNSLHVYERHFDMLDAIADVNVAIRPSLLLRMDAMLCAPNANEMMRVETMLRNATSLAQLCDAIASANIAPYWLDWMRIIALHNRRKHKDYDGYVFIARSIRSKALQYIAIDSAPMHNQITC